MNFIIIIPARFFASRFPGKLLANIHGKPVIVRVIEKALTAKPNKVIIATDSVIIKQVIESEYFCFSNKLEIFLTQSTHKSGTERISEVVKYYNFPKNQIIVHLQGDEPLISSFMINQVAQSLCNVNNINIATLATPIHSLKEAKDSNIVKVVVNINNNALYFSRSTIPWIDKHNDMNHLSNMLFRHIGIYSYRANFFDRYIKWAISPLEKLEMLEQLRVLWNGEIIRVSIVDHTCSISIDTPESLKRANELFLK